MTNAIATLAINGTGTAQARNWFECSKRKLALHIKRGTFERGAAISLLRINARDFARCNGLEYDSAALDSAAKSMCDYILTATE